MKSKPSYRQGHLVVAAVRVLAHRHERPPTIEEIAELTGVSDEIIGLLVRSLAGLNIVRTITSPFETRVEITDHIGLEELPADEEASAFAGEVDAFHEEYTKKQAELQRIFSSGKHEEEKKKKLREMEDELKGFQGKKIKDDSGLFEEEE